MVFAARWQVAHLAAIGLSLALNGMASAQDANPVHLETLLLEGDPIPGTDEHFVVLDSIEVARDGIAIGVGLDGIAVCDPRVQSFNGMCLLTFHDGLWTLNGDRQMGEVARLGQMTISGDAITAPSSVVRQPSLFDAEGRVIVNSYPAIVLRTEPDEPPDFDLDSSRLLDDGTRFLFSAGSRGVLGGEMIFGVLSRSLSRSSPDEYFLSLGDPTTTSARRFRDPQLPLAPGTSVLGRYSEILTTTAGALSASPSAGSAA